MANEPWMDERKPDSAFNRRVAGVRSTQTKIQAMQAQKKERDFSLGGFTSKTLSERQGISSNANTDSSAAHFQIPTEFDQPNRQTNPNQRPLPNVYDPANMSSEEAAYVSGTFRQTDYANQQRPTHQFQQAPPAPPPFQPAPHQFQQAPPQFQQQQQFQQTPQQQFQQALQQFQQAPQQFQQAPQQYQQLPPQYQPPPQQYNTGQYPAAPQNYGSGPYPPTEQANPSSQYLHQVAEQYAQPVAQELTDEEIDARAFFDPQTQAYNFRYTVRRMQYELARANYLGRDLAIMVVSIDNLPALSGEFGPPAVDKSVESLAAALFNCCRPINLVGRYTDGRFVVVCPEMPNENAKQIGRTHSTAVRKCDRQTSMALAQTFRQHRRSHGISRIRRCRIFDCYSRSRCRHGNRAGWQRLLLRSRGGLTSVLLHQIRCIRARRQAGCNQLLS